MAFEWDVLISYAHIDNQPLPAEEQGWVTRFHHILEERSIQILGTKPRILRQDKTKPEDAVKPFDRPAARHDESPLSEHVAQFAKVASLISIVSPQYVRSQACHQELQSFCRAAARSGGLWLEGRVPRVYKVVKTPMPIERQPRELQGVREYDFFEFDGERLVEYGYDTDRDLDLKFIQAIDDLIYDIHKLMRISATNPGRIQQIPAAPPGDKVVYLAETSHHLTPIRDEVRRELELSGCWVLPDRPLPYSGSFSEEIQASLVLCELSVHLLDVEDLLPVKRAPAAIPLPHVETYRMREQLKLAAERSDDAGFAQLLWVPGTRERDYWEPLLSQLPGLPEVLQTGVEELKTVIQGHLEDATPAHLAEAISEQSHSVYLDFDGQDLNDPVLNQIRDWLSEQFEVLQPDYGSREGVGSTEYKLRQADGVLIYYGQGSEIWLKRRLNALRKSCSAGRSRLPRAVYVGEPPTPHKRNLNVTQVSVVHTSGPFSPEVLQLFATRVNDTQEG